MTTFNLDRAVTMLARIEIAEETGSNRWGQDWWATIRDGSPSFNDDGSVRVGDDGLPYGANICGTAFCGAGLVVAEEGIPFLWEWDDENFTAEKVADGSDRYIAEAAADLLGVDYHKDTDALSLSLFSAHNSLGDMYHYVALYAADQIGDIKELYDLVERRWKELTQASTA